MSSHPVPEPRLSVIIPTCNRDVALARCLERLAHQTIPATDLEVIVVDDSGRPSQNRDPQDAVRNLDLQLIRHAENSGAAAARNTGAREAHAPFLAFLDDDCLPEPEWAGELSTLISASKGAALAGVVRVSEPQPTQHRVTQLLSNPTSAADGTLLRAQTANLAVPANGFEAVGGFDESYRGAGYEDYDFCLRWRATGRRILAAPRAVVLHQRDTSLLGFWRQHYRYGRGAAHFYGQGADGPRPPLKSSLRRIAQTMGAGRTLGERFEHTGLVGLSQIAMLAGFAAGRISKT